MNATVQAGAMTPAPVSRSPKGRLFVISGPSGVGKGTLLRRLFEREQNLCLSISATTRAPRPGEEDGVHYHFMTREAFEQGIEAEMFLEHAEYGGNLYGTPRDKIAQNLQDGLSVFLEIEVKGAQQVQTLCPEAVLIYVQPPTLKELERRLRDRRTENEAKIQQRLAIAHEEQASLSRYHYVVVNDDLNQATEELNALVNRERYGEAQSIGTEQGCPLDN